MNESPGHLGIQSLYIRWEYTLDQTLEHWNNLRSLSLRSIPTGPHLCQAEDIWDLTGCLCSPAPALACQLQQLQFGGLRIFMPPPHPRPDPLRSWESAVLSQASHLKPCLLKSWPSSCMPYISQLPL